MTTSDQQLRFLTAILQIEEAARKTETLEGLRYALVNELRRIVDYRYAVVFSGDGVEADTRIEAVSGIPIIERDAPQLRWLERAAKHVASRPEAIATQTIAPASLPESERAEWSEWSPSHVLWCPLIAGGGRRLGALWLARETPWDESEFPLIERIAACHAHAWLALTGGKGPRIGERRLRRPALIAGVVALLALAFPVSQSALAPVEIVATEPVVVASPIDGVVARFLVTPNQAVAAGQPLFEFDDTALRNQALVAERTLGVARAELRQAIQGAVADRKQAAQVALLEAQTQLRSAELDYARTMLSRVVVKARRAGLAVFTDANDWIGRPVVTGQRILQIADPERVEARIALPVRDAISLEPGARIEIFLDNDPLGLLSAHLTTASYEADQTPAGVIAYRLTAALDSGQALPRIGLQGTANIHGRQVPLLLYFFRRPLTALRQWLGY